MASRFFFPLALLLAALSPAARAQTGTVSGIVVDAAGVSLPGVNVVLEGTQFGTASDATGRFTFEAPVGTYTLVATYIGYQRATQPVTVASRQTTEVRVTLTEDLLGLDEVLVVGYGTQERRTVGGAVGSVRPENIQEVPIATLDNALQGRIAGVQVTQNSGVPGAALTVRVRGATSISAGNQPLYVVDGVPLNQGDFSGITGNLGGQSVDALADLNPNEIASIEVLKDASAAAIYGSRASNGVVLITTKRGRAGKTRVTLNAYTGTQEAWRMVDFLDARQYVDVYNDAILNDFGIPDYYGFTDDGVENYEELDPSVNTNWVDEVTGTAPISSTSLSIEGGNPQTRYYVTGSYLSQGGIVKPYAYDRLNGRLNLDYEANAWLRFGTNVSLSRATTDRARGDNTIYGPFANAIANPPIEPIYTDSTRSDYYLTLYDNPVGLRNENEAQDVSLRTIGNAFAEADFARDFTARVSVGVDNLNLRSRLYDSPRTSLGAGFGGRGISTTSYVTKVITEGTLAYDRNFGTKHEVNAVVGLSYEDTDDSFESVTGTTFPTEEFRFVTSAASITEGSSSLTTNSLFSTFGRVTYTFNRRYSITGNLRRDGSSRFGQDNRYGVFPAVSLAWNAYEEGFLKGQNVVEGLRLRASVGQTGNQLGIGNFASRGLFGSAAYGDNSGLAPAQLANPKLSWETTTQYNVGTEFSLLNDRLAVTADYYVKQTDDLLVNVLIPSTSGYTAYTGNIGGVRNTGFELSTRINVLRGSSSAPRLSFDLNAATNANEVTDLYNDQPLNFGFVSRVEKGKPLGYFYGYQTAGLFQIGDDICKTQSGETTAQRNARCAGAGLAYQTSRTSPGDVRFVDRNGDGVINADDQTRIGSPWPKWTGGLSTNLGWRSFDLTAFLQFSYGNDVYNATRLYTDAFGAYGDNSTTRALDRWRAPDLDGDGNPIPGTGNTDTDVPRATGRGASFNTQDSDLFVEDGSYLRLKNVVLGYTLPARLIERTGMRTLRVYVQAQNLATWTDYSGFDPEVNYAGDTAVTRGTDFYTLPQARTYTVGVTVGL